MTPPSAGSSADAVWRCSYAGVKVVRNAPCRVDCTSPIPLHSCNCGRNYLERNWRSSFFCGMISAHALAGAAHAVPPTINSISPSELVQNTVPQPTIVINGSQLVVGIPSPTNRPTVTLQHTSIAEAQYSVLANVNFSGTVANVPPGNNEFNLLNAPLGAYDVTVTRPDGQSDTLEAGLTIALHESGISIEQVSYWGGAIKGVDVVGDLAYVAQGPVLRILNIADPENTVELGWVTVLSANGVKVRDGYAYVAGAGGYRFCVVDVSNPRDPKLVWTSYDNVETPENVLLYGNIAYTHRSGGRLEAFDVTDPHNVMFLGAVFGSGGPQLEEAVIAGDILYVVIDDSGGNAISFRSYDLASNPLNPVLIGAWDPPANLVQQSLGLSVEGGLAAWTVVTNDPNDPNDLDASGLWTIDLSSASTPAHVGTYINSSVGTLRDVDLSGGFAFVADDAGNPGDWNTTFDLAVIDVTTPAFPTLVTSLATNATVQGLNVIEDRAYLFDPGEGLIIVDIAQPLFPLRLGNYHSPAVMRKMAKAGDLLYIADAWNGFTILNVSDPQHPQVAGIYFADHYLDLGVDGWDIAIGNDRAYLGAGPMGLEVIDVSNPANPNILGAYRIPSQYELGPSCYGAVYLEGNIVHVGAGYTLPCICPCESRFLSLNVTDPQNIWESNNVLYRSQCQPARTIEMDGECIAYLAYASPSTFRDVTLNVCGGEPVLHEGETGPIPDLALDAEENILYLVNDALSSPKGLEGEGVYIYDVTEPANPVELAYIGPFGASAVGVQNERLYVAGRNSVSNTIYLFDVSSPSGPILLDTSPVFSGGGSSDNPPATGFGASFDLLLEEPYAYRTAAAVFGSDPSGSGLAIYEMLNLPQTAPGDINGDGVVNVLDLLALISAWGACQPAPATCPADLDGNGTVNVLDLLIVIGNWG